MSENLMLKGYVAVKINAWSLSNKCKKYLLKNNGVTAVEYAIVVAGIAAIVLFIFGDKGPVKSMLNDTFTNLETKVSNALNSGGSGGGSGTP
ncbi:Flp family type IVb pilin [Salmonella enterica subsp. enterica]|nr:Flp family type IVb pilin [Salmonella enterica subsp. enterica serovar Berkeley]EEL6775692.1 Flp family type IVb pilin [Salmonella enterica subsp. enterica serovar Kingston]MJW52051.1 Flp family type IVb pilin [Salmonella enterica subsp. enterica serovar Infantis]